MSDNQALSLHSSYRVTVFIKNVAPLQFIIRQDQHDIWKALLSHGSTEGPLVLQDHNNDTVLLKLYDVVGCIISKG